MISKIKYIIWLIRYGKFYYGIHPKGKGLWAIGYAYCDGYHYYLHLGRPWIVYSERNDL